MLLKKINLILCILIALVFVGQMYMIVMEPYFLMTEEMEEFSVKEAQQGKAPIPYEISLFEMIWLKFHDAKAVIGRDEYGGWGDNLALQLMEIGEFGEYEPPKNLQSAYAKAEEDRTTQEAENIYKYEMTYAMDHFEEKSNYYVMGVVGVTVLGLVVLIMTIFTRKSIVHYVFTVAWAAVSVWAFFNGNPIIQKLGMPYAYGTVLPTLKVLSIAAVALTALRAYPWFHARFIAKEKKQ